MELLDPFYDCDVWQCPEPLSAEEAASLGSFEPHKWYIVDRKLIYVGGPFDSEAEGRRALRQLNREWRGFGPDLRVRDAG